MASWTVGESQAKTLPFNIHVVSVVARSRIWSPPMKSPITVTESKFSDHEFCINFQFILKTLEVRYVTSEKFWRTHQKIRNI